MYITWWLMFLDYGAFFRENSPKTLCRLSIYPPRIGFTFLTGRPVFSFQYGFSSDGNSDDWLLGFGLNHVQINFVVVYILVDSFPQSS